MRKLFKEFVSHPYIVHLEGKNLYLKFLSMYGVLLKKNMCIKF
jgi:hypothetical protein